MNRDHKHNDRNRRQDVDTFISEVLSSIDDVDMVSPAPYFYSRVKARLESRQAKPSEVVWLRSIYQTRWSLAYLLILIALNVAVVLYSFRSSEIPVGQNGKMEQLIGEYQLDYTSLYGYLED